MTDSAPMAIIEWVDLPALGAEEVVEDLHRVSSEKILALVHHDGVIAPVSRLATERLQTLLDQFPENDLARENLALLGSAGE